MTDLTWVKEIQVVDALLGCTGKDEAIRKLNTFLDAGWRLLKICTTSHWITVPAETGTACYYVIGR